MAGYKCVNFVDLCRLCAGSGIGGKTGIFSEEGKRKNMLTKINSTLTLKIFEKDRLPKSVCGRCVRQLEAHVEFREAVQRAQEMLQSCLNSTKLKNGGMVYIKDDSSGKDGTSSAEALEPIKPVELTSPPQLHPLPTLQTIAPPTVPTQAKQQPPPAPVSIATATPPTMTPIIINSLPKGFVQTTSGGPGGGVPTATIMAPNADFLNSIMQAVGIQAQGSANTSGEAQQVTVQQSQAAQQQQQQHQMAQYTITLDGQTIKANQIHYKIQDSNQTFVTGGIADSEQQQQQQTNYTQMDEFLKLKTPAKSVKKEPGTPESAAKKPKFSVLIKSPATASASQPQQQHHQQTLVATSTPNKTNQIAITASPISITPISSTASLTSFANSPIQTSQAVISSGSSPVKSIPVTLDAKMFTAAATTQGNNKTSCMVPIMVKTEGGGEQIALAPISTAGMAADMGKGVVPGVQYVQMKLQPGPDGMFRLAPAGMPPALTLTPQGLQQFGIQPLQQAQPQQQQQIQIQPQQLAMPSVQVPLSNYLSLVEKSGQAAQQQQQQVTQAEPQPNLVITTQPVQQQPPPQPQVQQQQTPQLQLVQRSQPQPQHLPVAQQPKPKPPKPNPPPPPMPSKRRESSEDQLNSSTESIGGIGAGSLTAQSIAATQQMKAISALSIKQDLAAAAAASGHHDAGSGGGGGGNAGSSSGSGGVSFTACDVCSKTFKRKEHLMQHLKSHVGLRPFKCEEPGCSKSFSRKEHLMRHIVSHTGKKLFSCPVCRKYFSRKDNLNKHKKTHTENSSSAPFHCSICSKGFYMKSQFLKHKQMHESGQIGGQKIAKKVQTKERSDAISTQQQQQQQPQTQSQPVQQPPQPQQQQQPAQHQTIQIQQQPITIQQSTSMQPTSVTLQQVSHQQQQQQQHQQIFTIPAHQLQGTAGKGQIIQIAMPTSMAQQQQQHHHQQQQQQTIQTVSGASLAGLTAGAKTAIIKSADGSTATVYNIPSNFIIDGTQFLSASRELMGNIKIEQIS